jgi:hypothetical protein
LPPVDILSKLGQEFGAPFELEIRTLAGNLALTCTAATTAKIIADTVVVRKGVLINQQDFARVVESEKKKTTTPGINGIDNFFRVLCEAGNEGAVWFMDDGRTVQCAIFWLESQKFWLATHKVVFVAMDSSYGLFPGYQVYGIATKDGHGITRLLGLGLHPTTAHGNYELFTRFVGGHPNLAECQVVVVDGCAAETKALKNIRAGAASDEAVAEAETIPGLVRSQPFRAAAASVEGVAGVDGLHTLLDPSSQPTAPQSGTPSVMRHAVGAPSPNVQPVSYSLSPALTFSADGTLPAAHPVSRFASPTLADSAPLGELPTLTSTEPPHPALVHPGFSPSAAVLDTPSQGTLELLHASSRIVTSLYAESLKAIWVPPPVFFRNQALLPGSQP